MDKKKINKTFTILFSFFMALYLLVHFYCRPGKEAKNEFIFKNVEPVLKKWDNIFHEHEIIDFYFDEPGREIFSIGDMVINSKGDYIILDGRAKKVLHFDSRGHFVRYIGRQGEGPGEFFIAACPLLDESENLYLFDIGKKRINKYRSKDFSYEDQIKLSQHYQDIIIDPDGDLIGYTLNAPENTILFKLNIAGEIINKTFTPKDSRFRMFLARFQLGRISDVERQGFLFIYPKEYKVYHFDYNFNLRRVLTADKPSTYFPFTDDFPGNLSPYGLSPAHLKWWSRDLHTAFIFYLKRGIFLNVLFKYTNLSAKRYVNIHDLDGKTYAVGVEVPFDGIIRYAKDDYVYVIEDSKFDKNENVVPLKLHRFKLKDLKK